MARRVTTVRVYTSSQPAMALHRPLSLPVRMPTVLRTGPYRFYFYSHEPDEPAHVHVDRDDCTAKVWVRPVTLAWARGFADHELRRVLRLVEDHAQEILEAWNEHLG